MDDFLSHHRYFYNDYDRETELQLLSALDIESTERIETLSPMLIRWLHAVAAIARGPAAIILDLPNLGLSAANEKRVLACLDSQVRSQKLSVFVTSQFAAEDASTPMNLVA